MVGLEIGLGLRVENYSLSGIVSPCSARSPSIQAVGGGRARWKEHWGKDRRGSSVMTTTAMPVIYYLPGHGGRIDTGLGRELIRRGYGLIGRETIGAFLALPFQEQVDLVAQDLLGRCGSEGSRVVANSYGAYLFLHAQAQLPPYPGSVLLLSPIVGEFTNDELMVGFIPPRSRKLWDMAQRGALPAPSHCEIHVGAQDWQSNPQAVTALAVRLGLAVTVVPNAGHALGKQYVGAVLDRWLNQAGAAELGADRPVQAK